MITLLVVPLLLPWLLPPLARRTSRRVRPDIALWAVTAGTAALALGAVACLGALLLPLTLRLRALADLAHLLHPLQAGPAALVFGAATLAGGALAVSATAAVRGAKAELARLRAAKDLVAGLPEAGGLCVLDDERPDAFALPGGRRRTGRVVVTAGMLRALDPSEREALLGHERAHLAGRHHLFLAVAQLAGWCHPALASVIPAVSFAAERAADEAAARACGDRRLAARAIGRAALATTSRRGGQQVPAVVARGTTGPVPARVKALFAQAPVRRTAPALLAIALLCGAAGASSLGGAVWLHRGVEVAQGERPSE
ncbi:Zn-dependent protease with chaperone function [Streptomyces sp. 3211.6]|uniref:M48 family metalloprotease n=1 Tax=Streptomyces sp. 3211.6 TaxID=1938845 RepID=UPI000EB20024|nr:M48 family metalloprotease [Streptomyces sp. 3211.6]RKT02865.1 Zn-dependent protease with chaperone function [Streptomyces sp. 3211.6]